MPRNISEALRESIAEPTTRLASLLSIARRNGIINYITNNTRDIVFEGQTYIANKGFDQTAIESTTIDSPDDVEIIGVIDEQITYQDVRSGELIQATVEPQEVRSV